MSSFLYTEDRQVPVGTGKDDLGAMPIVFQELEFFDAGALKLRLLKQLMVPP